MLKNLGTGIGLRRDHFNDLLSSAQKIDWLEIVTENFMYFGGRTREVLLRLAERYPIIPHGLGLSIGSPDPLDQTYMQKLKELIHILNPPWFSDHLCFSSFEGIRYHDLLPILLTEESLQSVIEKVGRVQEAIDCPLMLENISYYTHSAHHTLSETEFISRLLKSTGAYMLLDINNVYVNSVNLKFDPLVYLQEIPAERVGQIHLAGHFQGKKRLIDTHGAAVADPVWDLYRHYLKSANRPISTLIEWDSDIPSYLELLDEALKAKAQSSELFPDQFPRKDYGPHHLSSTLASTPPETRP